MRQNHRIRVAGYIFVSVESQIEGHSLDAQRNEIERWCKQWGYELARIYVEERKSAYTDRIERRPMMVSLPQDAKSGRFDIVAVHNFDRWSRNLEVQRQALQRLRDAKVGFTSVSEDIYLTTPSRTEATS